MDGREYLSLSLIPDLFISLEERKKGMTLLNS